MSKTPKKMKISEEKAENPAVTSFRTYLRINTVQPNPDYAAAEKFYISMAKDIGLDFKSVETAPGKPFAILTWKGTEPGLPSVMLYCHTDVVPVFPEHWKYEPFSAHKDEQGNIYARGAQDMKCVGIQYLEAIRRLKEEGVKLKRTVHVLFGPDEEIGAHDGMEKFVVHKAFKDLNIGFGLDEGLASPTSTFRLFYGERSCWWFKVTFKGSPGHGSAFIENTAFSKLHKVMNRAWSFREEQEKRLKSDPSMLLGDVTTLNINIIQGGVQYNVVPDQMSACFDVRIATDVDLVKFEEMIHQWCKDAGEDYSIEFGQKQNNPDTSTVDDSSPWWKAFSSTCRSLGMEIHKEIFPAGTDSRFLRRLGIPVYGFSPMNNTPILLHDHNEFLNERVFLRGIDIYHSIIPAVANVKT